MPGTTKPPISTRLVSPVSDSLILVGAFLIALIASVSTHAQTYVVLHRFKGTDGAAPYGLLTLDRKGNLYGMTRDGGAHDKGTVFKLSNTREKLLYSFSGTPDGAHPLRGLIRDSAGNLYGATALGGTFGGGAVFKLDVKGNESVLYGFAGGKDGEQPQSSLVRDPAGILYGTTLLGGTSNNGTVFKVDTTGTQTVLHSFAGGADGEFPYSGLIRDAQGYLYGTTGGDGFSSLGTIFKVDTTGHETVLYSFQGGVDGEQPMGSVIRDSARNLYGTTYLGGSGSGTVFKLDKNGNHTVLYSFAGGADGANPLGGLVRDQAGTLYGTTENGGTENSGTVFAVDTTGRETVLHSFSETGRDGKYPEAGLVRDSQGNLYGVTYLGGTGNGIVFKLIP
jgi:uncharacterized repeat protein (TIGR03803 family)